MGFSINKDSFWAKGNRQDGCNVWLPKEKCVDEWKRVRDMRKSNPSGLVAGGNCRDSTFEPPSIQEERARWEETKRKRERIANGTTYNKRDTQPVGSHIKRGSIHHERGRTD